MKETDMHVKILLMEGSTLCDVCKKQVKTTETSFGSMILDTIKVPFV